jgi:hypothetical protein
MSLSNQRIIGWWTTKWKGLGRKKLWPKRGISLALPGGSGKDDENLSQGNLCLGRDSNQKPPEQESRTLPLGQPANLYAMLLKCHFSLCKLKVSTAVTINTVAFWDMTPYALVDLYHISEQRIVHRITNEVFWGLLSLLKTGIIKCKLVKNIITDLSKIW